MESINEINFSDILLAIQRQVIANKYTQIYNEFKNDLENFLQKQQKLNEFNLVYQMILSNKNEIKKEQYQEQEKELKKKEENLNSENEIISFSQNTRNESESSNEKNKNNSKKIFSEKNEKEKTENLNKLLKNKKIFSSKSISYEEFKSSEKEYSINSDKFICNFPNCNKKYKAKENLTIHIKNKHIGEKPYCCKFCGKKYSHRSGNNIL
jgi:hypothetical protein